MNPENRAIKKTAGTPDVLVALGQKYQMEIAAAISDDMLDSALIASLPVEWARAQAALPVRYRGHLAMVVADPTNLAAQKHLELLLGQELLPLLALRETILNAVERCYFHSRETPDDFLRHLETPQVAEQPASRSDDLLRIAENAPVTQLINLILLQAVKREASDIHIEPFEARLRIRYRIDGMLYEQTAPPKHMEAALVSRLKVMAHMDIAEKRLPQDGVARVRIGEREIDIRVSSIPVAEGERVVLRLLDRNATLLPLAGLGMTATMLTALEQVLKTAYGVILVCGPTGSGKTTTLYAMLQHLDKERANILTIEDPIEYQLPNIGQIQVKPKIGLTFASGLRHILRQDPDTILVGEIRDLETAEIALRASLTGHLVFSTLHTHDAPSAVIRLMDMGIEPYLVAASLRAVLAQRLVRRLCPQCRQPDGSHDQAASRQAGWQARGCPACLEGYRGRLGIFELMSVDPEMAEAIRAAGRQLNTLRAIAQQHGMRDLADDAQSKLAAGMTSATEILRALGTV